MCNRLTDFVNVGGKRSAGWLTGAMILKLVPAGPEYAVMRAGSVIVMLVLLAAVWWQTDQLSEARTRNKLLIETATGYDRVIQEVKATAIQTHKLLAEVRVREQQRNAEGEHRREAMQAAFNGDACAVTLCLTLSVVACKTRRPRRSFSWSVNPSRRV